MSGFEVALNLIESIRMETDKSLLEAIEKLYKVFSRYPLRKHVEGCPCCVGNDDKRMLESKPLRELTSADLGRYSFKAMTTWGDKDDFRHFLPRIFELLVSERGIWDTEIVVGKLGLAEWQRWSEAEKSAVREYFRANWNWLIGRPRPLIEPDSWLCGMNRAGEDLGVYLDDWASACNSIAYEHLAKFIEHHTPAFIKRHSLNNGFWPDSPQGVKQVCDWLANEQTRENLEQLYFENESGTAALIT